MKKNELRFTVNFNENDPIQLKAANILNSLGRQKAFIIARAICAYSDKESNPSQFDDDIYALENNDGIDNISSPLKDAISSGLNAFN